MRAKLLACCIALALVSACQRGNPPQPRAPGKGAAGNSPAAAPSAEQVASGAGAAQGIVWFGGDVPAAFALAKREGRPVLLFWGAQWCPFCHTLKATVFTRPDFIAKTRLFVPVYLDGDNPGAQSWGEQFSVLGYPTLVVLDADQREIIRLGAGRDVAEYASVLDVALEDLQPIDVVLPLALLGKGLSADQCRRLAYNSWELETVESGSLGEHAAELEAAAHVCPVGIERADLTIYAAAFAAQAVPQSGNSSKDSQRLGELTDQVASILGQPELALASAPALTSLGDDFFKAARLHGGPLAATLRDHYVAAMDRAASDPRFALADQLGFIDAKLDAMKALAAPRTRLPDKLLEAADQRVDSALAGEKSPYVRPGLVNAALNILEDTDQFPKAYQIAKAEIDRADSPYYFQADLAEVAEKLGHKDEALQLLDVAYHGSRGPATRFQWGIAYVSGLLRMAPQDSKRIEDAGLEVLGELDGTDRIAARARVRLGALDQELRQWNAAAHGEHADVLQALRSRVEQICVKIPADQPARSSCDMFLMPSV